uniref:NADP-dependent oxidoreductase domain-containing protein n=1 Tax=Arundo donax TaxID=35708 RepID=A0A0A9FFL2_ARUDO
MSRIKEIGGCYGKSPTQVALNWLTSQENVVAIPGAKNASQAKEFAGALGWSLTREEVEELRPLSKEIKGIKMPIEES